MFVSATAGRNCPRNKVAMLSSLRPLVLLLGAATCTVAGHVAHDRYGVHEDHPEPLDYRPPRPYRPVYRPDYRPQYHHYYHRPYIHPVNYRQSPRVRVGQGSYRLLGHGIAELSCIFPVPLLSNVVWTRADGSWRPGLRARPLPGGSSLLMEAASPLDAGLYRCVATALHPAVGPLTVFQDVDFCPLF